ncbi:hypothetical protein KKH82_02470 [Patescibacteria group bacterium]|nr:hypothetical protein [Patescibacteria group bacterium]
MNGFTVKELEVVDTIYKGRARMINSLEDDYPDLEDNNTRQNMSDDFYDDMKDILDDRSNRTLDDYGDFVDAFKDRYNYTIDHR